ncbi:hypothetical protein [Sphaerimonospora cavernae]|uniref:hypothetical protein n=1 Tax=Sphaerimonospora cavernae TaxID=1740611 RepID=UPI00373FCBF9
MLTPVTMGTAYRRVCDIVGLRATSTGWGMIHCVDAQGKRWTLATADVEYVAVLAANAANMDLADMEMPGSKFPWRREGWPDDWLSPAAQPGDSAN